MSTTIVAKESKFGLKPFALSDGTVEGLKWLALILMAIDHVNAYVFGYAYPALFAIGRLAMPLFVATLAYNLARPTATLASHLRTMKRLVIFGLLATPSFMSLSTWFWGWYPLNMMFTLLTITGAIYFSSQNKGLAAALVILVRGGLGEFFYPAVLFGVAFYCYVRKPGIWPVLFILMGCASLYIINSNHGALWVIPLLILATQIDVKVPRVRWFFYAFYPLHLSILAVVNYFVVGAN